MVLFRKKKASETSERIIQLSILHGNNQVGDLPGKIFTLQCGDNIIGRDPLCEVALHSGTVSRRHANLKVSYDKKSFTAIDLGSSNGIIIMPATQIKSDKRPVNSGDKIQVGEILLQLLAIDEDESLQTLAVDFKDFIKNDGST
jgi:pSer/pThr/pTyr-binding forkhead associated (FHA) protein